MFPKLNKIKALPGGDLLRDLMDIFVKERDNLSADLAQSSGLNRFRGEFPERFINCGIVIPISYYLSICYSKSTFSSTMVDITILRTRARGKPCSLFIKTTSINPYNYFVL